MKKAIATELTSANIAQVLALLTAAPAQLARVGQQFSAEQLRQPLGAGQRSRTEVLAHMLHCEARAAEAIYSALLVVEPEQIDLHPERQLGKLLRYDRLPFADLLAYFNFRRTVLLRVLAELSAKQWARTIRQAGKNRQESVYWQARGLALHELEHLTEIEHH